ncbi:hypothetical protein [Streptomyces sp. OE57]|uniref:hypothetical protein n=1 Tax=Streptomyces lacaronensis TaxID=3379885 RepID=UPI0039B78122
MQLTLFTVSRDFRRFDREQHADLAIPWLVRARQTARVLGEVRGWSRWITSDVGHIFRNPTIRIRVPRQTGGILQSLEQADIDKAIATATTPLDELTHRAVLDWLDHRRGRWPNTANPHLLIMQKTAVEPGPAGRLYRSSHRGETRSPGYLLDETLWAWSSSATTATGPVPCRCATSCWKIIGPTWTGTRRK